MTCRTGDILLLSGNVGKRVVTGDTGSWRSLRAWCGMESAKANGSVIIFGCVMTRWHGKVEISSNFAFTSPAMACMSARAWDERAHGVAWNLQRLNDL